MPGDLAAALAATPVAQTNFTNFAPGQSCEYLDWVIQAKRPESCPKRIEQTVNQVAENKTRNWKDTDC